jgi:hypothetical protein
LSTINAGKNLELLRSAGLKSQSAGIGALKDWLVQSLKTGDKVTKTHDSSQFQ